MIIWLIVETITIYPENPGALSYNKEVVRRAYVSRWRAEKDLKTFYHNSRSLGANIVEVELDENNSEVTLDKR